ncbi:hypothetical protein GGF46_005484 [Coemansia sp. RSA 552]|nr:hypothetical protein GGF46_005484 [Coemansia sp. RSA 552]
MCALTSRLFVVCAALSIALVPLAQTECISLQDSQGCPGFAHEFISTNATSRFSWYPYDDISAFDRALSDYVVGQSNIDEFQSVFRCSGLDDLGGFSTDHGPSVVRYHRSMICADLIFSQDNLNECYGDSIERRGIKDDAPELQLVNIIAASNIAVRPSQPTPLCRSTCESWLDSLHTIIANTTLCKPDKGNNREVSLDALRRKCNLDMYNGPSDRCVDGEANELKTCGYQRVEDWCKYCDYATDYADVCASVGVAVDGSSLDKAKKNKPGMSDEDDGIGGNAELEAELERQRRQERMFRAVAIVLSIVVGVCLIALIALVSMGHRVASAKSHSHHDLAPSDGGASSTLLHLGDGQAEKGDFVDCFVATVGKPRQVVRPFFARREDEISLKQGDTVTLQMAFDDGWVVGKNLTSGTEGTFPLMCVMECLPASLPAQWSVLPESKNASVENLCNRSTSVSGNQRPSIDPSQQGMGLHSTRNSLTQARPPANESQNRGLLGRLLNVLSPAHPSTSTDDESEEAGFFKRLMTSPFGRQKSLDDPTKTKTQGRPHSFNVHHVVHVGLDSPNYPAQGDSLSTVPSSSGRSANRYPIMSSSHSALTPRAAGAPAQQQQPTAVPQLPLNTSRQSTAGNISMDTYRTAEQSNYAGSGVPLQTATPTYLR